MIILTDAYILAEEAAGRPVNNPRIGYQTHTRDLAASSATASTTAADAAADAPLRPDTYEYWKATALPATWAVDLGVAHDIDYIGIAGHTIGTEGASVEAFYSTNNSDWYSFTDTKTFLSSTGEAWTINGTARVAFDSSHASAYVLLDGVAGNCASTPDSVTISVTGDLDARTKAAANNYASGAVQTLISKVDAGQRSWKFEITGTGFLNLQTSVDGINGVNHLSTVALGLANSAVSHFRATLDVDNGAAGHTVRFFTSSDGVAWTQLGADVVTAGVITLFDGTAPVRFGETPADGQRFTGKIYSGEIRSGIGGTVVAKFDPLNDSSFAISPGDDAPIMFLNTAKFARYWQLYLKGTAMPQVAVVYVGQALAMERAIYGGVTPPNLARDTVLKNALSRGGRFLGQSFRRNGVKSDASFRNLTPSFVRDELDLFIKSARRFPYFFAWRPATYPKEIIYAWTSDDIAPSNMGKSSLMQVAWPMRGIGHGD